MGEGKKQGMSFSWDNIGNNGATGGTMGGGKIGSWKGSKINMGGSGNTPLYIVLGGFFVLVFTEFVIWASRKK